MCQIIYIPDAEKNDPISGKWDFEVSNWWAHNLRDTNCGLSLVILLLSSNSGTFISWELSTETPLDFISVGDNSMYIDTDIFLNFTRTRFTPCCKIKDQLSPLLRCEFKPNLISYLETPSFPSGTFRLDLYSNTLLRSVLNSVVLNELTYDCGKSPLFCP